MTSKELIDSVRSSAGDHVKRIEAAFDGRTDDHLNRQRTSGEWSPYEVIEHLRLSNAPYHAMMDAVLKSAPAASGDALVRHTMVGRFIIKGAGPSGNVPAPKAFVPAKSVYSRELYEVWKKQQETLQRLCDEAEGKDLMSTRVRNPLVKFLRLNLADCFAILDQHTERHVRQIEERVK